ncbi:formyltetrahydrofolate deformylase [Actinokineospora inagensis]|uniref:formyltetrahydrofolate deformylase n=1 Tax=Actinokineospora inagensis TaxID=103730 RepID=UPI00041D53F6|nr:formyltetrahydrofolate deformylase [Actinokineospora inagensis]
MPDQGEYVLTGTCPDAGGILAAVTGLLTGAGANIVDCQQFSAADFFTRVQFRLGGAGDIGTADIGAVDISVIRDKFAETARALGMTWSIDEVGARPRTALLVSKHLHCLNDLLFRHRTGELPVDVTAIVSNHPDAGELASWHGIPFHHVPVTGGDLDDRDDQEARLSDLLRGLDVDLVVLARYMRVLGPRFCAEHAGRMINIHHSFLPSFKGARPYAQAHAAGVKLIGATAHYVTPALDEGQIIEQDVLRVDHRHTPARLRAVGQDLESRVLARAVTWHAEHRVLRNGNRTVVFA